MRILVVGGGPAGSFAAISLLQEAERRGVEARVTVLEAKPFHRRGPRGCNFCAGVITERTMEKLRNLAIDLPPGVIQRRIEGFYYVTEGGRVEIDKGGKESGRLYSVFRGGGPLSESPDREASFDQILVRRVEEMGAEVLRRSVSGIARRRNGGMTVSCTEGEELFADVVVGAFGVNSPLARGLKGSLGYTPPATIRVFQAEIRMDNDLIEEVFKNRIFAFALRHKRIRFLAVTPKREYLTLTAMGNGTTHEHLEDYFRHPAVARYFNERTGQFLLKCSCRPLLPVGMARGAFSDGFVAVGDAYVCRYYKNGLGSAYFTAAAAARAIMERGISRRGFALGYKPVVRKRFVVSNFCGRMLFALNDLTYKLRPLAHANASFLRREKARPRPARGLNDVMWSLFVGDRSYCSIVRDAVHPLLLGRMFWWYACSIVRKIRRWMINRI